MYAEKNDLISDLIKKYGESGKDIIVQKLRLESRSYNRYHCPNGVAHKHNDKTPSMSWVPDKFYFHCHACGENITIYSMYKKYLNYTYAEIMRENGIETIEKNSKNVSVNASNRKPLTEEQIKYLTEKRGFNGETIHFFKLFNLDGAICFPYYKNGNLIGIKKRMLVGETKNISVTGSKFFLFNFDNVDIENTLYITEGEFDCMTLYQAGIKNCVSIGCGANSTTSLFEHLDDYMDKINEIVIVSDRDDPGDVLDKSFIDKYKMKVSVVDKSLYNGLKDVNDVMREYGDFQVKKIAKSGRIHFDGEWDLEAEPYKPIDQKDTKFIKTNLDQLDYSINCIQSRLVTLVTGRSNAGKSTFVNQIVSSAIQQEYKVFLAIGEGNKDFLINRFYTSLIGSDPRNYDVFKFGLRDIKEPKPEVLKAIQEWHKNKLRLWVKALSPMKSDEEMFQMITYKIKTEKYDLVVLDNQMSLLTVEKASEKNEAQARFVQKCHNLAVATNTAVILVLHPNKTYKKGEEMDFEQISGTSDIPNKADVVLNVIRVPEDDDNPVPFITTKIQISKNRYHSEIHSIPCAFDSETYTFAEVKDCQVMRKNNSGWKKYLQKNNLYTIKTDEIPF